MNLSFNYFHAIEKRLLRYERIEVLSDGGHGFGEEKENSSSLMAPVNNSVYLPFFPLIFPNSFFPALSLHLPNSLFSHFSPALPKTQYPYQPHYHNGHNQRSINHTRFQLAYIHVSAYRLGSSTLVFHSYARNHFQAHYVL